MRLKASRTILSIIFLTLFTSGAVFIALNSNAFAQTEVEVGIESETEIKVGEESETESEETESEETESEETESSAKSETRADVEVKVKSESESESESSVESETKAEMESKSETKAESSASSENKAAVTIGDISVTTKGGAKISVGLPEKYPSPAVNAKSSMSLQTNQHLYKPGDTVYVEGSLWTELLASLSDTNVVTVKVFDKTKTVIFEGESQITADGDYSAEFMMPDDASKGSYTVTSTIELDGEVSDLIGIKGVTSLGASAKVAVVPPAVFTINVENHGNYDVKVATNSTVNSVEFNGDEKKVSVTVEGESGTKGVSHISIPKEMVSGNLVVMIDGKAVANDKVVVTSSTQAETEVEINYDHSVHTIDVIGTQAVPEFGTVAILVLVATISGVVVLGAKTKMQIIR